MENLLSGTIAGHLRAAREVLGRLCGDTEFIATIEVVARRGAHTLSAGGKILFAGNGGSAADSQHLAAELVGRYAFERQGLAAVALTADTAALTAIGNDMGFERIFARQIEAIAHEGDMLIALSTSGRSPNVIAALKTARAHRVVTVGLTGRGGGDMAEWCDHLLAIPSTETPRIQEGHKVVGHIICGLIEELSAPQAARDAATSAHG
jgi:D-sedoheptulose 7-phosphate isomerase